MIKYPKILIPTKEDPIIIDRDIFKSIVREISEEMFRNSTIHWSYHDMHDIMGDGKRLPKAQKIYRRHYDFVRSCLRRNYIEKEKENDNN